MRIHAQYLRKYAILCVLIFNWCSNSSNICYDCFYLRSSLMEEKRRLENKISSVEDELEEEQQNSEQAQERIRRAQQQVRRVEPMVAHSESS